MSRIDPEQDLPNTSGGNRRRRRWVPWAAGAAGVVVVVALGLALAVPPWLGAATRQAASTLTVGRAHSCLVRPSGEVACWGANDDGQLGDATTVARTSPTAVLGLMGVASVVAGGGDHTCALIRPGSVVCWGRNDHGQLGDGTTGSSSVPVPVAGLTGVVGLALGRHHSCAVLEAGGVRCWGGNGLGELGDGSTTDSATPVDVVDLPIAIAAVSSQANSTCAVTVRGRLRCWGDNSDGQLANRDAAPTSVAVAAVGVTSRVARVAIGDTHGCALRLLGGVVCWGANDAGQLGRRSAQPVAGVAEVPLPGSGVTALSSSEARTCAVRTGGVLCWGRTAGEGDAAADPRPVEVLASGAAAVAVGPTHSCALTDDGRVLCWGANTQGQLGDGTTTDSARPVEVAGL